MRSSLHGGGGGYASAAQRALDAGRQRERTQRTEERAREKELQDIKLQYLGEKKQKKRMVKASEKFRFNFDWENTEDTSRDHNPLYDQTHQAALLFGRGLRAGFDRKAQKQTSVAHERELIAKIRKSSGVAETEADRADTRAALKSAENYEEAYFSVRKECHWSDKPLDEMTERDWRIFKEDFNISYKVRESVSTAVAPSVVCVMEPRTLSIPGSVPAAC
jgi:ATP-dependent RNA helicase DDX23/PRP28